MDISVGKGGRVRGRIPIGGANDDPGQFHWVESKIRHRLSNALAIQLADDRLSPS